MPLPAFTKIGRSSVATSWRTRSSSSADGSQMRRRAGVPLPNAMALATAGADGRPSVRHVLLRGVDERGFEFFTNYRSRKSRQLDENPNAGLVFLWKELDRQVNVTGSVRRTSAEDSDAYFATRPRDAQLGAWASHQSEVLTGRDELEARLAEAEAGTRRPSRDPRTGGASSCPRTRSSSGRGDVTVCTTASASPPERSRAIPGSSNAFRLSGDPAPRKGDHRPWSGPSGPSCWHP